MLIVVRFIMFVLDRALKFAKLTPEPESEVCHVREASQEKKRSFGIAQIRGDPCHTNIIIFFGRGANSPLETF